GRACRGAGRELVDANARGADGLDTCEHRVRRAVVAQLNRAVAAADLAGDTVQLLERVDDAGIALRARGTALALRPDRSLRALRSRRTVRACRPGGPSRTRRAGLPSWPTHAPGDPPPLPPA